MSISKQNRIMDTIDASADDVSNLYKAVILYNLCMHFEKKFFGKEVEFIKEAHNIHQKTIKSIKCSYDFSYKSKMNDGVLYTTDGVQVALRQVLKTAKGGEYERDNVNEELRTLCYKYDAGREFKIIPVFEDLVDKYWRLGDN